jgi:hypothetical protein
VITSSSVHAQRTAIAHLLRRLCIAETNACVSGRDYLLLINVGHVTCRRLQTRQGCVKTKLSCYMHVHVV